MTSEVVVMNRMGVVIPALERRRLARVEEIETVYRQRLRRNRS